MSKLEAAMEAVKASKTVKKSARGRDADDPLSLYPDIEMSIGNPASSLRMHSIAALQVSRVPPPVVCLARFPAPADFLQSDRIRTRQTTRPSRVAPGEICMCQSKTGTKSFYSRLVRREIHRTSADRLD